METTSPKPTADTPAADNKRNPWSWIPTLYFAQGIPFVAVNVLSVMLYKRLGLSNTDIALYTSWFYLPWVIKPLWSPLVEIFSTKRFWIVLMQLLLGGGMAAVALTIPTTNFVQYTLAFFWLLAFTSATHDIAADGFYMLGLTKHQQAWFVGVRSTFFRLAMITGQGLLVMLAGHLESRTGLPPVELTVRAEKGGPSVSEFDPESIQFHRNSGELKVMTEPSSLSLGLALRSRAEADELIAKAREWNRSHGFYKVEETAANSKSEPGFVYRVIGRPLESVLRYWFPKEPKSAASDTTGNVGLVYFYLSGDLPENETVTVNFGRESGDKSIRLVEGERFVFNSSNADKPFAAVVQLDPKLTEPTSATLVARSGNIPLAWSITFFVLAGMFLLAFIYHQFVLPRPVDDQPTGTASNALSAFFETLVSYFKKPGIITALAFILLYRFAEAQLVKLAGPFLLDAREVGGLALSTGAVGFVYGTVGVIALTIGGIVGGIAAARNGLKFWLPLMVCAINLPNLVYVYLSFAQPESFTVINICVAIEQFGYGFGFAAYLLYMIYFADGKHKTAHYAICTGFMALGMMIPGMFSGWLQEILGYKNFFVWVIIATIPSFLVTFMVKVDPEFGKKTAKE